MKVFRQMVSLVLLAALFLCFDITIYENITKKYINYSSEGMQAKSVELDEYLPFDENSQIARVDSSLKPDSLKLEEELPVIDGAAALYPVFSAFVGATYPEESVSFDGTDFLPGSALRFSNTRGAYKAIVDGDADIVFCAKPSEEQLAYAQEKGVELKLVPIGCEAFVFIVNSDNPVDGLTVDEIRGIYSGKYTRWSQVGGDDSRIDALQRNEGSGSQTAMLSFMGGEEMKRDPLGFTGRAIGYSFRFYVSGIVENGGVKMLALNGVYPDENSIADGSYPIVSNFFAVCRADDENPNIGLLLDWILSDEGQRIIKESGYVPLRPIS